MGRLPLARGVEHLRAKGSLLTDGAKKLPPPENFYKNFNLFLNSYDLFFT